MTYLIIHPRKSAFTLMELMAVIGVVVLLSALTLPALKSLTKSNDQSQAANLVRSMIDTARSIALSQHRQAGVVFFEETVQYSRPSNTSQTAMQLFVEDYDQQQYGTSATGPVTVYVRYSGARQYLPTGVKLAVLSGLAGTDANMETGDNSIPAGSTMPFVYPRARTILFDANGQISTRSGLATPRVNIGGQPGSYPMAYGDWNFFTFDNSGRVIYLNGTQVLSTALGDSSSYPGFFLYNKSEYDAQAAPNRAAWIKQNADVIIVNANTGTILR